jgi:hypothetical protein
MKIKLVKRKFYNKWDYKISFYIHGSSFSRFIRGDYRERIDPFYFELEERLNQLDKDQYAKRIERNTTDIYLNDKSIFDEFRENYKSNIRQLFEINPVITKYSSIDHVVVCNKYPHDKYRYKVYLQPHKVKDKSEKINFIQWLGTQTNKIKITDTVKTWFITTDWNWDRRYMYVEDEQTLLMLQLRKNEAIGTIYNYILTDK